MIECGAGIGAAIIALDEYLKASGAKWRTPVLAAAVGIYLPLDLTTPIFLGGLLTWFVERRLGVVKDDHDAKDRVHRKGVLFSAGLITGEALIGHFHGYPHRRFGQGRSADAAGIPAPRAVGGTGHARRDRVAVVSHGSETNGLIRRHAVGLERQTSSFRRPRKPIGLTVFVSPHGSTSLRQFVDDAVGVIDLRECLA
jgi:hypothetical protein